MVIRAFALFLTSLALLSCQATKTSNPAFSPRYEPTTAERKYALALTKTWNHQQEEVEADIRHLQFVLDADDARHLLERSGIGAHPFEIAALIGKTRSKAVSNIIRGFSDRTSLPLPTFINTSLAPYWIRYDYDENKREAFRMARDREMAEYRLWWIREMIETASPQTERMVLFWHNHFVSAYSSIQQQSIAIARQNVMFRSLGMTNFRTLTKNIIRDPAMLNYLDNDRNEKGQPNENFARELMELFTLGEGNYDEFTVKEAARALTGFSVNHLKDFSFELKEWRQDDGSKLLFGRHGNFDGDDLVDLLLKQPAASEFITRKFWRNFVSETFYQDSELSEIANKFRASDYDLKTLYRATFTTPSFWVPQVRGTIVKSPVDMVVGTVRSTGFLPADWMSFPAKLKNLGQHLFEPPNVAGWPGGYTWITPSSLLSRRDMMMNFFDTEGDDVQLMMKSPSPKMMGRRDKLIVRYGAENFQGPPKFRVTLYKNKGARNIVWRSDLKTAIGGYDTELNGRIKDDASIPWQTMVLDFNYKGNFEEASVEFINDHCCGPGGSQGGDRNFFVDWVRIADKAYLASKGRQRSNCPPKKASRSGRLYCRGDVVMSEAISLSTDVDLPRIPKDHLVVDHVALDWLNNFDPDKNWQGFSVALLKPRFNDIKLDGMKAQFVRRGDGDIHLTIESRHCQPDCFAGNWPNSAHLKRDNVTRLINLSLIEGYREDHEAHYRDLTKEQKAFVNAIWASFPQMLREIKKGRRWRRNGKKRYSGWKETVDYILQILPKTRYAKNSVEDPLIVLPSVNRQGMMIIASGEVEPPRPAGQSPIFSADQWDGLVDPVLATSKSSEILLALTPIVASPDDRAIANLINDPSYNLK